MDLDHYHRRPQMNTLSPNAQYDGNSIPPSNTELQMPSYDGLPRIPLEQSLLNNSWEQNGYTYNIAALPMSSSPSSTAWTNQFEIGNTKQYYSYNTNTGSYAPSLSRNQLGETPRTLPCDGRHFDDQSMSSKTVYQTPPSYYMELNRQGMANSSINYEPQDPPESARDFARLSISPSAKTGDDTMAGLPFLERPVPSRVPRSESSAESEPSSREMTAVESEEHGVDEPYAKLIYRALMSAPNHSMVLQEIYRWFRENTTKGSSDTKGWMNSIRHNLSMNAAFKKTERKPSSDETKKSTEWVLENFAIKDGVQSTTRYRKGTGSKKFVKSDTTVPTRHTPNRKGGFCTSKAKIQRQKATRDERSDLQHTPYSRLESERPIQYNLNYEATHLHMAPRQISPLTPNRESIPSGSPYFYSNLKHEASDINFDNPPIYSLGDVHGVCSDSPLFSLEPFNNSHTMCNNSC